MFSGMRAGRRTLDLNCADGQEQYSVLPWIVYMRCPLARKLSLLCTLFAFGLPLRLVLFAEEQSTIVIP